MGILIFLSKRGLVLEIRGVEILSVGLRAKGKEHVNTL
jgi:hypothetical protein